MDYINGTLALRFTEIFFIGCQDGVDLVSMHRLVENVAQTCCRALQPSLHELRRQLMTVIGLRVKIGAGGDNCEYDIGGSGTALSTSYLKRVDELVIPAIYASLSGDGVPTRAIEIEFLFRIL